MSSLLLSSLGVVCPQCDHLNAPQAVNCVGCGKGFAEAVGAAESTLPSATAAAVAPAKAAAPSRPPLAEAPPGPSRPDLSIPPGMRPTSRPPLTPGAPAAAPPVATTRASGAALPQQPNPGGPPVLTAATAASAATRPVALASAPVPAAAAPAARAPAAPPVVAGPAGPKFGLTVLAGSAVGQRFRLPATGCMIGRSRGAVLLSDDPHASPHHATLSVRDGRLVVKDESSTSGVYVSVSGQETIPESACFAVGDRVFRYGGAIGLPATTTPGKPTAYGAPIPAGQMLYRIEELYVGGRPGRAIVTAGPVVTIGQGRCDLAYPKDRTLASCHCELAPTPAGALLKDLSSGLGTYVRVPTGGERVVRPGDRIRIGQHVLQVEAIPA